MQAVQREGEHRDAVDELEEAERQRADCQIANLPGVGIRRRLRSIGGASHRHEIARQHRERLKERRQDRVARHDEPRCEHEERRRLVHEDRRRVREHALEGRTRLLYGRHDPAQAGSREHHARGGLGHVRRGRHGDPHLGLPQGGCVVDAVAAHADRIALALEPANQPKLLFRENPRIDGEVFGPVRTRDLPGRTHGPRQPDRARHCRRRRNGIAGDHDGTNSECTQLFEQRRRILSRRVAHGDGPDEPQRAGGARRHRDRSVCARFLALL